MAHHISQLESELQNIPEAAPKASLSFSVSGWSQRGQPLTYDFRVIREKGVATSSYWVLPVPSTASWRAEIDGKRFSGDERDRWKFLGYRWRRGTWGLLRKLKD
jgi:hypothetical protein